jgi:uncharacterized protein YggE
MPSRSGIPWPILLALSVVGAQVLGACGAAAPAAAPAPTPAAPEHTIEVTGQGQAFGAPDVAYVSLGISVTNADVGQAVSRANQVMADITKALGQAGIDPKDIQTTNYNVWPEQKTDPVTNEPSGPPVYHVDSSLQVKVREITNAGKAIQMGLDAGANTVNGLSFGIDDPKPLQSQARASAIDDARQKASELADALGVKLGNPIQVNETSGPSPVALKAIDAAQALGGGQVPISTGQLSVSVSVDVTFELLP